MAGGPELPPPKYGRARRCHHRHHQPAAATTNPPTPPLPPPPRTLTITPHANYPTPHHPPARTFRLAPCALSTADFKNGLTVLDDNKQPVKIMEFLHVKPGKVRRAGPRERRSFGGVRLCRSMRGLRRAACSTRVHPPSRPLATSHHAMRCYDVPCHAIPCRTVRRARRSCAPR